jgi:RimJ/RimL family protein N-acetyltransferase
MPLIDWKGAEAPNLPTTEGKYVYVSAYDRERDLQGLYEAICGDGNDGLWTYIPFHMPKSAVELGDALDMAACDHGWQTHIICDKSSKQPMGMASYMRIRPEHGSVEVGCIVFARALQRTNIATEAIYLMIKHAFDDLNYRRFEWKCHNENEASKRAAVRFGFTFEGVFRNDMVMKGKNRDTAWYSITDTEWGVVKTGYEKWLDLNNFDTAGVQRQKLLFER